jgi:hypothetical protein
MKTSTFRSLRGYNYRVWSLGAAVSNVGTWMQRKAQDWIVLTQLTQKNAAAVGIVIALQFASQVLLLPMMGLLALGLGLLTVSGAVRLWRVYLFAGLLGWRGVRLARAPDLRVRHGHRGRPGQRGRAQLDFVQCSADDRPRARRSAHRRETGTVSAWRCGVATPQK